MKQILFTLVMLVSISAQASLSMSCSKVDTRIERCENDEVICYLYDTGWAGMMKSGRGAGISCVRKD